jgi:hypothetical protein
MKKNWPRENRVFYFIKDKSMYLHRKKCIFKCPTLPANDTIYLHTLFYLFSSWMDEQDACTKQ